MRSEGGVLNRWKERGLFALTAAVFAALVLQLALSAAPGETGAGDSETGRREGNGKGSDEKDQRYVRGPAALALPVDASQVFAPAEPIPGLGPSPRTVIGWPKEEKVKVVLRLQPPPAMVPAPPMLLPVPGPTLGYTSGFPRWPGVPLAAGGDGQVQAGAVEGETGSTAGQPAKPPGAVRPEPAAEPRPEPRKAAPREEAGPKRRSGDDDEALRERLRRLQRILREKGEEGGGE